MAVRGRICAACGAVMLQERKNGRPRLTCSSICSRIYTAKRRGHKIGRQLRMDRAEPAMREALRILRMLPTGEKYEHTDCDCLVCRAIRGLEAALS